MGLLTNEFLRLIEIFPGSLNIVNYQKYAFFTNFQMGGGELYV